MTYNVFDGMLNLALSICLSVYLWNGLLFVEWNLAN